MSPNASLPCLTSPANISGLAPLRILLPFTVNSSQELAFHHAQLPELDPSGQVDLAALYAIAKQYTPKFDILSDQNLVLKVAASNGVAAIVAQIHQGKVLIEGELIHVRKPLCFKWGYGLNFDIKGAEGVATNTMPQVKNEDHSKPDMEITKFEGDNMPETDKESLEQTATTGTVARPSKKKIYIPASISKALKDYRVSAKGKDMTQVWQEIIPEFRDVLGRHGRGPVTHTIGSREVSTALENLRYLPGVNTQQFQMYSRAHERAISGKSAPGWLLIGLWWQGDGKQRINQISDQAWGKKEQWLLQAIDWAKSRLEEDRTLW